MSGAVDVAALEAGILSGDRVALARAITLIESTRPEAETVAEELVQRILPRTGRALRVGISGAPGVGKSSFIEALGTRLVDRGHRLAVLAVDPSSSVTGGSILGDKSRMEELGRREGAFIRPSPSAASLGGVARRTREALLLCEAAGHDVVFVETVGVGQSETAVADMTDFFLVLMLPGAGDELQGIKKGILELADLVAVNKADGERVGMARAAQQEYAAALHYARPGAGAWTPRAVTCSSLTGDGLDEIWDLVLEQRRVLEESGEFARRRAAQLRRWMWNEVEGRLMRLLRAHAGVRERLADLEAEVGSGRTSPVRAARELLDRFLGRAPKA